MDIYHNPDCGTSRNVLALLRHAGLEPRVVEYLKTPPTRAELTQLVVRMGVALRTVVREKGTPYFELGLDRPGISDDELLDAMIAHPVLINRPIVAGPMGVRLCRPSDVVLDLVPDLPATDIDKEEGAPFLKDAPIAGDDAGLAQALAAEGLPTDDLPEPGRTFFTYRTLSGALVGHGGFELFGADVLLRSIVVAPEARGRRIGRNLVPLLMRRAFDLGARRAWVLTTSAAPFFETIGFKRMPRASAPNAIAATRQFAALCPSSAVLLSRPISL